ncbi:hypothetical protein K7432_008467 [Basidiobolus ranarum]|uniref:RPA-interacting protein C-terminal domain-containing protein n=1 Tax=Basidiobolus ranarum TaxID=34480 RepID=A0ABR2VYI5_9FUNG
MTTVPTQRTHTTIHKRISWRERFIKECLDKFQKDRISLVNERRRLSKSKDIVLKEMVSKELSTFLEQNAELVEDFELIANVKTQHIIQGTPEWYEFCEHVEQEVYKNLSETIDTDHCNTDLKCPLCKQKHLQQKNNLVYCLCGFRVNTQSDSTGLAYLKDALMHTETSHKVACHGNLMYQCNEIYGSGSMLIATCDVCELCEVVL